MLPISDQYVPLVCDRSHELHLQVVADKVMNSSHTDVRKMGSPLVGDLNDKKYVLVYSNVRRPTEEYTSWLDQLLGSKIRTQAQIRCLYLEDERCFYVLIASHSRLKSKLTHVNLFTWCNVAPEIRTVSADESHRVLSDRFVSQRTEGLLSKMEDALLQDRSSRAVHTLHCTHAQATEIVSALVQLASRRCLFMYNLGSITAERLEELSASTGWSGEFIIVDITRYGGRIGTYSQIRECFDPRSRVGVWLLAEEIPYATNTELYDQKFYYLGSGLALLEYRIVDVVDVMSGRC